MNAHTAQPTIITLEALGLFIGPSADRDSLTSPGPLCRGDEDQLARILYGMAVVHQQVKRGCGNITEESLLRTKDGQLVLVFDLTMPSVCEQTPRNDPIKGRFFANVGNIPCERDDLTALGVVVAELLVEAKRRPAITDARQYRLDLAEGLRKLSRPWSSKRKIGRLAKSLLLASGITTTQFIQDHIGVVRFGSKPDSVMRRVRIIDIIGLFPWVFLLPLLLAGFVLLVSFFIWESSRKSTWNLKNNISRLEAENFELKNERQHLRNENASLLATIAKLTKEAPPAPSLSPNPIADDPRFQIFERDINLNQDKRFRGIVRKDALRQDELLYADQVLSTLVQASRVWWDMVENRLSSVEVDRRINAESEPTRRVLNVWRGEVNKSVVRNIRLKYIILPGAYEDYQIRITVRNLIDNEDEQREFVWKQKSSGSISALEPFRIKWKEGQAIPLWLESWSWWNANWNNQLSAEATGALALPLLARQKWEMDGISLEFEVDSLPGPPTGSHSHRPVPSNETGQPSPSKPITDGIPISPEDLF